MKIEFDGAVSIEVPTDDELSEIYDTVKGTMQQEEALDLMREIKERTDRMAATEGTPNALDEWNIVDKITWFISEAYCIGFIRGMTTAFDAIAEQVKEGSKNE